MDPATAESERPLALGRAEQCLLDTLESIVDGFALYDAADRLVYINDSFLSIHKGRREDYPAGLTFLETTWLVARSGQIREAAGREEAWVAERMASHRNNDGPFLRHLTDGRWIRGAETETSDGSLVVTLTDITGVKESEDALRESERHFRDFASAASEWFWEMDENLRFAYFSDAFWRIDPKVPKHMIGKTRRELIERNDPIVDETASRKDWLAHIADLEAHRPFRDMIHARRHSDGTRRYYALSGTPYFDAEGAFRGYRGITRHITEQKRADAALRDSERRNRAIVEALDRADVGVCIQRFGQKVNFANSALTRMAGYRSQGDLIDRTWVELQGEGGTDLLAIQDGILESLKQDGFWSGELDWMRPNGTRITVDARLASFPEEQVIHILTDITERKARERQQAELTEQLRQAQKMEALGQLAGGTAHEINNLLHPIITFAKLAHDRVEDEKLQHYLDRIMECGRKAKEVVGDVLTFARKAPGKREEVDLNDLLARSLRFARDLVPPGIKLDAAFPEQAGRALANETEFIQVVLNLVKNAADALEGTGTITLAAKVAGLDNEAALHRALAPGTYLEISVQDRGCGMTEETKQRIFEPFFTTKPVGQGTGLGLAVAYGIVQDWGGGITVDTKPGEGSTFTVYQKTLETTDDLGRALPA